MVGNQTTATFGFFSLSCLSLITVFSRSTVSNMSKAKPRCFVRNFPKQVFLYIFCLWCAHVHLWNSARAARPFNFEIDSGSNDTHLLSLAGPSFIMFHSYVLRPDIAKREGQRVFSQMMPNTRGAERCEGRKLSILNDAECVIKWRKRKLWTWLTFDMSASKTLVGRFGRNHQECAKDGSYQLTWCWNRCRRKGCVWNRAETGCVFWCLLYNPSGL